MFRREEKSNFKNSFYCLSILLGLTLIQCGKADPSTQLQSLPLAKLVFSHPFEHDFGMVNVGESKFVEITITNDGDGPATEIDSFFVTAAFRYQNGFPGTGGNCTDVLEPGERCQVIIHFVPPLGTEYLEILRVSYFDGAADQLTKKPLIRGAGVVPGP